MNRIATVIALIVASIGFTSCSENVSANSCSAGGITSAIGALPAGGVADFSNCGSMSLSGPITIGTPTAPVTLVLGTGTTTFTNNVGDGFVLSGSGSRLIGQGANSSVITTSPGFTGDIIHVEPVGGQPALNGIEVAELTIDQTNAPTAVGLNLLSVRDPSSIHNLDLTSMTGTAIQITTSPASGAKLPQGIGLRDIYITTAEGPLTADTVVVTGNQVYLGPNVKILNFGTAGSYRGLVIKPTPTPKGDGRYNTFFSGAVYGYGTCASIEAPDPNSATGALGNIIGPGNTFENCSLAYEMTGVDSSHRAVNNWALGNAFLASPSIARLDIANENFVQELANGFPGTITLTVNSLNNTVFTRLPVANAISNSGTANLIYSLFSTTGFSLNGDLHVEGTLYKSAGSFRIDHPLDPKNKYLQHSFVESPDMMDIYNGVVTLGESGTAKVYLPDYFEALNRDFRYQLTPLGNFAPLYIAEEIRNNSFVIAGGKAGLRVSWQVTGVRHDSFANTHRIAVVTDKPH